MLEKEEKRSITDKRDRKKGVKDGDAEIKGKK